MWWELVIVGAAVAASLFFVARTALRAVRGTGGCHCGPGASGCGSAAGGSKPVSRIQTEIPDLRGDRPS